MPLPASGQISMSQMNTEMGRASNAQLSMNDSGLRTMSGVASGQHSFSNLHGKSFFTLTNPVPNGSASVTVPNLSTATAYITFGANGFLVPTNGTQAAYGSPTSAGVGSGKYFYAALQSGSAPNFGEVTLNTWTAFAGQRLGETRTSTPGERTGTFLIYTANDGAGGGQTSPGTWTITATVEGPQ